MKVLTPAGLVDLRPKNEFERAAYRSIRGSGITWVDNGGAIRGHAWSRSFVAPRPTTPLRYQVWLHELAHVVLHGTGPGLQRDRRSPWFWECEAERWSMRRYRETIGPVPVEVLHRVRKHLQWTYAKRLRAQGNVDGYEGMLARLWRMEPVDVQQRRMRGRPLRWDGSPVGAGP